MSSLFKLARRCLFFLLLLLILIQRQMHTHIRNENVLKNLTLPTFKTTTTTKKNKTKKYAHYSSLFIQLKLIFKIFKAVEK